MNRKTFLFVVVLAVLSISGIFFIQLFWMGKAFDLSNKQFEHNVNMALLNVTTRLCEINQEELLPDPIEQLSSNYFIVNLNNRISPNMLETILSDEFKNRSIGVDFEYGIFDCTNKEMVYGRHINLNEDSLSYSTTATFPKLDKDAYYFGVYFPDKPSELSGEMWIWRFSSTILVIVVLFFGYALFAIFKQKQLSEIQNEFVNNMTHEFKTPLATITLSAEVLLSEKITEHPARLSQYAAIIQKEASRLKLQVDRVLQMATAERNEEVLNLKTIDLKQIIIQAMSSFDLSLTAKGGRVHFDSIDEDFLILGDKMHMTNVISNLLDNAIKYAMANPVIEIGLRSNKNHIEIVISDDGPGIEKKEKALIFNKFYRIPTGNIHNVKGFGIGLHYVKTIVQAHKGVIRVESTPKGTSFIIKIPKYNA